MFTLRKYNVLIQSNNLEDFVLNSASCKDSLYLFFNFSYLYLPPVIILLSKYIVACIRFSIWLDSKLRLQTDPILILEYFLWRHGYEYAISNHYDRHCVWEEVAQNKKLNKFNHTIIDQQFEFYQADGLTRFNPSDPNKLLPSCMLCYLLVLILLY